MNLKDQAPQKVKVIAALTSIPAMHIYSGLICGLIFLVMGDLRLESFLVAVAASIFLEMFLELGITHKVNTLDRYHAGIVEEALSESLKNGYQFSLYEFRNGYEFQLYAIEGERACSTIDNKSGQEGEYKTEVIHKLVYESNLPANCRFLNSDQIDTLKDVVAREIARYESDPRRCAEAANG